MVTLLHDINHIVDRKIEVNVKLPNSGLVQFPVLITFWPKDGNQGGFDLRRASVEV